MRLINILSLKRDDAPWGCPINEFLINDGPYVLLNEGHGAKRLRAGGIILYLDHSGPHINVRLSCRAMIGPAEDPKLTTRHMTTRMSNRPCRWPMRGSGTLSAAKQRTVPAVSYCHRVMLLSGVILARSTIADSFRVLVEVYLAARSVELQYHNSPHTGRLCRCIREHHDTPGAQGMSSPFLLATPAGGLSDQ